MHNPIYPILAIAKVIKERGRLTIFFVSLTVFLTSTFSVCGATLLQQADSAYNAQQFRKALSLYTQVLDKKGSSSQLQYNLGNTHYRLGDIGKAVLAYERALSLDPSNKDARVNLNFVRSRIKGLPMDNSSFLSNIHDNIVAIASPTAWSIIAFIFFLLFLSCIGIYFIGTDTRLRKIGFFGSFAVIVLFAYTFIIAWQTASHVNRDDVGIVISSNAKLTSNPGTTKNKTEKAVSIPEGSRVEILDSLATPNDPVAPMWYNISLNNNTQAWIDATSIEKV